MDDKSETLQTNNSKIILHMFFTKFAHHTFHTFNFLAIDYLLKPVEPNLLINAIEKIIKEDKFPSLEGKLNVLLSNLQNIEKIALPNSNGIELVKV